MPARTHSRRKRTASADRAALLPVQRADMERLGWAQLDVLLMTGDAYVDHPTFGAALLGRWLVQHGLRVGIVAQPAWDSDAAIRVMGAPRLAIGITAGCLDSMLAHYTAFRRKRSDDAYTPGGQAGRRPNRATLVYTTLARRAFPDVPVVLGGIEASMRRATHYDFWSDALRRSILLDSKADLLIYGMAERALLEACRRLDAAAGPGVNLREAARSGLLRGIDGTAYVLSPRDHAAGCAAPSDAWSLPAHEAIEADPARLMEATLTLERQVQQGGRAAIQAAGDQVVVFTPPAPPLRTEELDGLYDLPFTRLAHPDCAGNVPALDTVRFSLTAHRGCAGGCAFCSLAMHQGRRIASRSAASILREARRLTKHAGWDGGISDIGGPTANMWGARCTADPSRCVRPSCLTPHICPHFTAAQAELLHLLNAVAGLGGVRHVRVASGVRYDLALREPAYLKGLCRHYVGGQLKVAPEHCRDNVLSLMRKPPMAVFERFLECFQNHARTGGREQYTVPYLISAYPGSTDADMRALRAWLDARHWKPQQVQCFIPLPGTVAAAMFFTGLSPDGIRIPVARTDAARRRQHAILMPGSRSSRKPS